VLVGEERKLVLVQILARREIQAAPSPFHSQDGNRFSSNFANR